MYASQPQLLFDDGQTSCKRTDASYFKVCVRSCNLVKTRHACRPRAAIVRRRGVRGPIVQAAGSVYFRRVGPVLGTCLSPVLRLLRAARTHAFCFVFQRVHELKTDERYTRWPATPTISDLHEQANMRARRPAHRRAGTACSATAAASAAAARGSGRTTGTWPPCADRTKPAMTSTTSCAFLPEETTGL